MIYLVFSVAVVIGSFLDHNFGGKPPIAKTDEGEVYHLDIKIETLDVIESKTPWGETYEATGLVKNFRKMDDKNLYEPDGEITFPFWSCDALQSVVSNCGKAKGWLKLAYVRSSYVDANREGKRTDFSEASFAERE